MNLECTQCGDNAEEYKRCNDCGEIIGECCYTEHECFVERFEEQRGDIESQIKEELYSAITIEKK